MMPFLSFRGFVPPITIAMAALALTLPGNAAAAAPTLELRDGGRAALSLVNAGPGDSAAGCVVVAYRGEEPARVRLYGATRGTGFERYLDLLVERGASCAAFRRETVVFRGTLEQFPDSAQGAIDEDWKPNEARAYRFEVQVRDDEAAQGLTARQTFTWVATGDSAPEPAPGATAPPAAGVPAPPGVDGLRELLTKIARVAGEVGKRSAFPSSLLMLVVGFLSVQNRIDRRDPKLALAPVYPTPDLPFDPPEDGADA
jgi:hypothetical protein